MNPTHNTHQSARAAGWWTRIAARAAAAVVALVAGAASFEHIASVAIVAGERTWVAYSLPLAIDGLIVVGVAALVEDQLRGRRTRVSARLAVLVGVIATLAANLASAEPTWTARLVALTAPVSFLLSVEVLTRTSRTLPTPDDTATGDRQPKQAAGSSRHPTKAPARTAAGPNRAARRRPTAQSRVAQAVAATPTATPAEIAARLKVSERTVQRYWPAPSTQDATPHLVHGNGVAPVPAGAFARRPSEVRQ